MQDRSRSNRLNTSAHAGAGLQKTSSHNSFAVRGPRRALWEALTFSLVMLIVVGIAIFGLCVTTRNAALAGFRHYLVNLLLEASVSVDPDLHERIRRPEQLNDPEYSR